MGGRERALRWLRDVDDRRTRAMRSRAVLTTRRLAPSPRRGNGARRGLPPQTPVSITYVTDIHGFGTLELVLVAYSY